MTRSGGDTLKEVAITRGGRKVAGRDAGNKEKRRRNGSRDQTARKTASRQKRQSRPIYNITKRMTRHEKIGRKRGEKKIKEANKCEEEQEKEERRRPGASA